MSLDRSKATAFEMFSKWYEYCIDNGIAPEEIVSEFGEMLLITNWDDVEAVTKLLKNE